MKRLFLALAAIAVVAGCTRNPEYQPPEDMAQFAFQNTGPTSLTLYTVINRRSGAGAHTALEVNASETVLFDPAGSFKAQGVPRSGDVLYGFSPAVAKAYSSGHARSTHYVRKVNIPVSPQVAALALQKVKANGPVGSAYCAQSTSSLLTSIPGFEQIDPTFYPKQLEAQFSAIPGAQAAGTVVEND